MDNELIGAQNPLSQIEIGFPAYVQKRKQIESGRMDGNGLPNYAFSLDYELRKKLDAIPYLYDIAKAVCGTWASQEMRKINISAIKVGPTQFPDVYEIGCDCARILGIGIPNIYIVNDQTLNAGAYAFDDVEPMIQINSGLYERMTPGELRCVIGHECGHIHNQHGVYNMLGRLILAEGINAVSRYIPQGLWNMVTTGYDWALKTWSRAAEVTCDRAGMICAENIEDAYNTEAKLMYGGAFGEHKIDYAALRDQLDKQLDNVSKLYELDRTHPGGARRIAAEMEFAECELLYRWRPDLKKHGITMHSKQETDERCRKVIDLTKEG